MRENPPHIDTTRIKMDDRDQSVLVARDIKDSKFADLVRTVIACPHVCKLLPVRLSGDLIPGSQCGFCIRMPGPELPESPEGNNAHALYSW
jgi:hypothetical protein